MVQNRFAIWLFIHAVGLSWLMACALTPGIAQALEPDAQVDLRILIDVSGSMKRTDPQNLRRPALRLLVGLLPEGARSGVWTFGKYVNMQVPLGTVDAAWKERAQSEAQNIHSRGLFTNIEEALKSATYDWDSTHSHYRRSLILLSDGMVDIAKDPDKNAGSRDRILNLILPRLRASGAKIHTIALSKEADHELLKALAVSTDGWYEEVDDAESLQRIFLRLFEKSAPMETLPLQKNRFKVDAGVEDMTLLMFRSRETNQETSTASVLTPEGERYQPQDHPENVTWHSEVGFDLVTVTNPQVGQWQLETKEDPDNRVMVLTNLKLAVGPLPNNILPGESVPISARLQQENKDVKEQELLQHVGFNLHQHQPDGTETNGVLLDNGQQPDEQAKDGRYSTYLSKLDNEGMYEVIVQTVAPTFQREFRHTFKLYGKPFMVEIKKLQGEVSSNFRLSIRPRPELQDLQLQQLTARLPGDTAEPITIPPAEQGVWAVDLPGMLAGQNVEFNASGTIRGERNFNLSWQETLPGQAEAATKDPNPPVENKHEAVDKPANQQNGQQQEQQQETQVETDQNAEHKKVRWPLVVSIVMVINALFGLIGVGGYWYWQKRRQGKQTAEEGEVAYE